MHISLFVLFYFLVLCVVIFCKLVESNIVVCILDYNLFVK